ncbi:putative formin-like protein 20 [Sesbania bispinosa]|nr:putative formin-like protein 20 [Sesbania bispinosa]
MGGRRLPSQLNHGSTPPGPAAGSHGSTPPGPAATSHGPTPPGLAAGSHGPPPTIIGSVVEGSPLPDEIDISQSQSQPPPINPSPTKSLTKVIRPKLKIRGKGATTQHSPAKRMSPQKSSANLNVPDSSKAMQFMPTPGVRTDAP